jgi:hypothetical protein
MSSASRAVGAGAPVGVPPSRRGALPPGEQPPSAYCAKCTAIQRGEGEREGGGEEKRGGGKQEGAQGPMTAIAFATREGTLQGLLRRGAHRLLRRMGEGYLPPLAARLRGPLLSASCRQAIHKGQGKRKKHTDRFTHMCGTQTLLTPPSSDKGGRGGGAAAQNTKPYPATLVFPCAGRVPAGLAIFKQPDQRD